MTSNEPPGINKKTLIRDFSKTSLGWELAIPIFTGAYIGYLIDKSTDSAVPYTLILAVVGIGIGYYNLMRHIELEMLKLKIQKKRQMENPKR